MVFCPCGNDVVQVSVRIASSFPRRRESSLVGAETYRENGFLRFCVLDSRFRGNDGLGIFIESRRWCFYANDR
ncbi:pilS cassette [Neisseria meningitidis]|nr:pilS cassette [Neisseria meningitidis]